MLEIRIKILLGQNSLHPCGFPSADKVHEHGKAVDIARRAARWEVGNKIFRSHVCQYHGDLRAFVFTEAEHRWNNFCTIIYAIRMCPAVKAPCTFPCECKSERAAAIDATREVLFPRAHLCQSKQKPTMYSHFAFNFSVNFK